MTRRPRVFDARPNSGRISPRRTGIESLSLLAAGRFEAGWEQFEWRWKAGLPRAGRGLPGDPWLGEAPIEGKTILVHAEQGYGDTLQFCR